MKEEGGGRLDFRPNDTQPNGTQHIDTQHNDIPNNDTLQNSTKWIFGLMSQLEQHTLKNVNNCWNTRISFYFETSGGQNSDLY
jgi:hypothetical protein